MKKEAFGRQRIDKVRLSDAKAWLIKLQQVDGRGYSFIHSIRGTASSGAILKKPIGKAAYFTNVFTNFAGTNMRKYETIY